MQCDSCKGCKSISKWFFFPRLQIRKGLRMASLHPLPDISCLCESTGSLSEGLKKNVSYFEPKGQKSGALFPSIQVTLYWDSKTEALGSWTHDYIINKKIRFLYLNKSKILALDGINMKMHLQDGGVEAGRSVGTRRQPQRTAGTQSCWPQSTARVGQLWSAAMQKIRNMIKSLQSHCVFGLNV